ncbi:unnamed protein product [Pipistrellus nathusii]|uniref:Uncharacterized protein n=1 Tax=Pipistrellus nathusii TaxID=59473 RepID=A0ABN9ZT92_PIPNA
MLKSSEVFQCFLKRPARKRLKKKKRKKKGDAGPGKAAGAAPRPGDLAAFAGGRAVSGKEPAVWREGRLLVFSSVRALFSVLAWKWLREFLQGRLPRPVPARSPSAGPEVAGGAPGAGASAGRGRAQLAAPGGGGPAPAPRGPDSDCAAGAARPT